MNQLSSKSWLQPAIMSATLAVAIFIFFGVFYPHHLHFQEQYQLFLFDRNYILDVLSIPGGVSDLIGRFFTQFFLMAWVGSGIISILLAGLFILTYRRTKQGWLRPLSMTSAIILWAFMLDENALLGAVIAIVLAQASDWWLLSVNNKRLRVTLRLITAPFLYWGLGPAAIICSTSYLISSLRTKDKVDIITATCTMLIIIVMPLLAQYWVAIPLQRLYIAPHYYRDPLVIPYMFWIALVATIIAYLLPEIKENRWRSHAVWVLIICSCGTIIKNGYNRASEEVMSYDFMCRFQQWNRLTDTAQKKKPKNSLSCTALNLALGMKGQLADHMFEYNQNGYAGLLPHFERDPVSPLTTSEVYYQLGMINTAQRLVFEAQEAIPDYQKSGRCYKRLAETNLICGNYEIARKYLQSLSKTMFYSDWAQETLSLLSDEAISKNDVYGRLRSLAPNKDYMFQDQDIPQLLRRQVLANGTNRLAYEYLECAYLLVGDLDSFVACLGMCPEIRYHYMPYMFQQAYCIWLTQNHNAQEKMPDFISPSIIASFNQFLGALRLNNANKRNLIPQFGNTYWYYYFKH